MDSNYGDVAQSWRMSSQAPLDAKTMVNRLTDLTDLGTGNTKPFLYYRGMKIYCHQTKKSYEWTDDLNDQQTKLLAQNFIYPTGSEYDGIDYSELVFNFVEIIPQYFSRENFLENEGVGLDLFNGLNPVSGNSKIARFNSSTQKITKEIDGSIKSEIDIFNRGSEDAISLYDFFSGSKIHAFSKIKSTSILITKNPTTGNIEIETPSFDYIKSFYVNSNYTGNDADGSIIRPFKTYDDARTAIIGTGTFYSPENPESIITLQTSATTLVNPTINTITIKFENNSKLTYSGTDVYMFDTELIYPNIPKGSRGELTTSIYMKLIGIGQIYRTKGIGMVRGIGDNRNGLGQSQDPRCQILIGQDKTDYIRILERIDYPNSVWEGDVTFENGTKYEDIYGYPFKWTTQLSPTIPLVYCDKQGFSPFNYGVICNGTVEFIPLANTCIYIGNDTLFTGDIFKFTITNYRIATASGIKLADYPKVYGPKPNKNFIEAYNNIYANSIVINESQGFSHSGVDCFFKFYNNAFFAQGTMQIVANFYVNKFIDVSDSSNINNSFTINNTDELCFVNFGQGRHFISTTKPNYTINIKNSSIRSFKNKSTNNTVLTAQTYGTLSSFFDKPVMSGVDNYDNDVNALASGLIKNAIYYNTIDKGLKTII